MTVNHLYLNLTSTPDASDTAYWLQLLSAN